MSGQYRDNRTCKCECGCVETYDARPTRNGLSFTCTVCRELGWKRGHAASTARMYDRKGN